MIINPLIVKILEQLEIPVALISYNGKKDKYIVFSTTNQNNTLFSDDIANEETISVGINYYYTFPADIELIDRIKKILKDNGFSILSSRDIGCVDNIYNYAIYCEFKNKLSN